MIGCDQGADLREHGEHVENEEGKERKVKEQITEACSCYDASGTNVQMFVGLCCEQHVIPRFYFYFFIIAFNNIMKYQT